MSLYEDKTALVTGASSGIGRAVAKRLAREGAHVFLVARRGDLLGSIRDQIQAEGGQATCLPCDVTDQSVPAELQRQIKAVADRLDLLVNNAGRELLAPLLALKLAEARDVLDVNVLAVVALTKGLLGLLREGAAIVNMASAAALKGVAGMSIYCASKGAIVSLTRSWARELAARGVRVNAVAPGMVSTELTDRIFGHLKPEQVADIEAQHPLGLGTPADVASAVCFLGSEEAAWITGQTLVVDGGLTA